MFSALKGRVTWASMISVIMFVLFVGIFTIATGGNVVSGYNLGLILRYSIPLIIGGLGMIFVVSQGGTDISIGATAALGGTIGVKLGILTQGMGTGISLLSFIGGSMLTGLAVGTLIGIIVSRFKVPSFMTSLAMMISLRGLINAIIGLDQLMCTPAMLTIRKYEVWILIGLVIIMGYVFKFTRLGHYSKAIGENEVAVGHVGISVRNVKLGAFMLNGLMAGIVGVFVAITAGGASNLMATGLEMRVLMSLFVGGVPVQGGMQAKLYKMIIGVPTIIIMENGLVLLGVGGEIYQAVQAFILVTLVFVTMQLNSRAEARALKAANEALRASKA